MERNDPLLNGKIRDQIQTYTEPQMNLTDFLLMSHRLKEEVTQDIEIFSSLKSIGEQRDLLHEVF